MLIKENHIIDGSMKRRPVRLTPPVGGSNDQLLYFTSPSVTADGRKLVFISDRTGSPNLFVRNLESGEEKRLTDNNDGTIKSYIYFDGNPYHGLAKASASLDIHREVIYYIQGREICAVNLEGERRVLCQYPGRQMTAYTHVSADGKYLCVPTTDARALDDDAALGPKPGYDVDERVRREKLSSWIRIYETATGEELQCERVPGAWVTHVQFSPVNHELLLYNNEWCSVDQGIRRIWLWDGRAHRPLRSEAEGRSRADYVVHEMWERDGQGIVYHGAYAQSSPGYENLQQFVGRMTSTGAELAEIPLPRPWGRYGHVTVGRRGELVTDGYYEEAGDPVTKKTAALWINGGAWITYMKVDWEKRGITWVPLCHNGSSWRSQDCHPHPIFNERADTILFTSDREGERAVYGVDVPERCRA